jgi:dipeptidyl aminopeptidase/acylaminoacyl peptidase
MATPKNRTITAEVLYDIQLLSDGRISPLGDQIVYTLQRVDKKTEKKFSNLWMVQVKGGDPYQYTRGDQADSRPRWSPDGEQIAFLSNRVNKDKPAKLHLICTHGGEARVLGDIKGEIQNYCWSPDGRKILCEVRKTDDEVLEQEKDENKKKLGVVYRQYDRVFYKLDGYGYLPKERTHLWVVDVGTGKARQITDHPVFDETHASWSPDGKWIVFRSVRTEEPDFNGDLIDLYIMPSTGGEFRKLDLPVGYKQMPTFSPDGRFIAYYGHEETGKDYKNNCLWLVPVDGKQKAKNLTEKFDLNISTATLNDCGSPELVQPIWSSKGDLLYFQVALFGSNILKAYNIEEDDLISIVDEGGVVGSPSFDGGQKKLAYIYGSFTDPCQVVVQDMSRGNRKTLTKVNRKLLDPLNLGTIEELWFKGSANNDLQGWILKPPGFDPKKKYPSILEIHGGPMTQYGKFFMHEFYYLASRGYVVYFSNPRGGIGYGEEHTKAIWGSWGNADYADLMTWADRVAQEPYIDSTRMGVTGGSYGGYMTVWIIGHTERFKAAVTQRCVSNFISMWGSSDMNWVFQEELEAQQPFKDLQKFWDMSPIKYIGDAKTPTMVIHNENDLRCPIEQGEQVFVALKSLKVETEFIRFPDEFHGLSRTGRTDRRIARLNHILRWFDRYLGDQPPA